MPWPPVARATHGLAMWRLNEEDQVCQVKIISGESHRACEEDKVLSRKWYHYDMHLMMKENDSNKYVEDHIV